MSQFWWGVLVGAVVSGFATAFALCLCVAASRRPPEFQHLRRIK